VNGPAGGCARAVGRPTLHGGSVVLRPVRATPCLCCLMFDTTYCVYSISFLPWPRLPVSVIQRSDVRLSVCPIFLLTLIGRAAHTQRDCTRGSMRRGQRIFRPEIIIIGPVLRLLLLVTEIAHNNLHADKLVSVLMCAVCYVPLNSSYL